METPNAAPASSAAPAAPASAPATSEVKGAAPAAAPEGSKPVNPADGGVKTEEQKKVDAAIRKLKLVIDGKEEELDEPEVVKLAQKGRAADKRFMEAAKYRQQAEQFFALLKSDPVKALEHPIVGHKFRELAEKYLIEQIKLEQMDPRDRENMTLKEQIRQREEAEKAARAKVEAERFEKLKGQFHENLYTDITTALKTAGLPESPLCVKRTAHYLFEGFKEGKRLKATEVIDMVKRDFIEEQKALFGATDGEGLLRLLGDDVANKIRQADIARVKGAGPTLPKTPTGQPPAASQRDEKTGQYLSRDEWREQVAKRVQNLQ